MSSVALPVVHSPGPLEHMLPALYAEWLTELGMTAIPSEELATCDRCAMSSSDGAPSSDVTFSPKVKCCTYLPLLPNFLVGLILGDDSSAGLRARGAITARLGRKADASPLGLGVPADHRVVYEAGNAFGRSEALRCPHYVDEAGGLCGIWAYRNSVCATWFCRHVRGSVGYRFWGTLRNFLGSIEADLSLHCALELDATERIGLDLQELNTPPSREAVTASMVPADAEGIFGERWRGWHDRPEEFYRRCAEIAGSMSWSEVQRACGVRVRARLRELRSAYAELTDPALPPRLVPGRFTVSAASFEELRITTYSPFNPFNASKELLALLRYFDGVTSTADALRSIAERENVEIDEATLRRLVDYALLTPASPPPDLTRPVGP